MKMLGKPRKVLDDKEKLTEMESLKMTLRFQSSINPGHFQKVEN